mmetsp:Transcript_28199/g.79692  ORF Transcript_28199/g.79692 Transcript_28199/m.79692 type:complete len:276 (+) Transcript_28199:379-1206(+)
MELNVLRQLHDRPAVRVREGDQCVDNALDVQQELCAGAADQIEAPKPPWADASIVLLICQVLPDCHPPLEHLEISQPGLALAQRRVGGLDKRPCRVGPPREQTLTSHLRVDALDGPQHELPLRRKPACRALLLPRCGEARRPYKALRDRASDQGLHIVFLHPEEELIEALVSQLPLHVVLGLLVEPVRDRAEQPHLRAPLLHVAQPLQDDGCQRAIDEYGHCGNAAHVEEDEEALGPVDVRAELDDDGQGQPQGAAEPGPDHHDDVPQGEPGPYS